MTILLYLLIGVCSACVIYFILDLTTGEAKVESSRIKDRISDLSIKQKRDSLLKDSQLSNISKFDQMLKGNPSARTIQHLLSFSGWNISVGIFVLISVLLGLVGYQLTLLRTDSMVMAIVIGAILVFVPYLVLLVKKKRYVEAFTMNFPDALMMIKSALKAGQGIQSAFQSVADEGPYPIAGEFRRIVQEIELGNSLDKTLANLYSRVRTVDLRIFTLGIFIQQEIGGNLTELIDNVEKTIRDRIQLQREMKVLSAQGKMSGVVLMLLPIVVGLGFFFLNATYYDPLIESETGRGILFGAFGLQIVGCYIIHKITSFSIV